MEGQQMNHREERSWWNDQQQTSGRTTTGIKGVGSLATEVPILTPSQRVQAHASLASLQDYPNWSGAVPVLLLNRCWLRLSEVPLERLAHELPPDLSWEAPELERYRQLIEAGWPTWQAQQRCWLEFGAEACQQALRRFWQAQEDPGRGWSLQDYLGFLTEYRHRFASQRPRPVPLLVLSRPSGRHVCAPSVEENGLFWLRLDLSIDERVMRHTCP